MSMSYKEKRELVLNGNIKKGILILSLPIMFNNLLQTAYNLFDTFWVGRIGDLEVSAVSSVWPVNFAFIAFGIGLSIAATSLISQSVGGNNKEQARFYASQLFSIATLLGLILSIVGILFSPMIIKMMGITGIWADLSLDYLQIMFIETPILFGFMIFNAIRQAQGDTLTPVIFSSISVVLNIILDPIFIFVFDFGVKGVAIATVLSKIVIAPFVFRYLFFKKDGVYLSFKMMKLDSNTFMKIFRLALPASLGQMFASVGFVVLNAFISSYGVATMAAFSVGNRITSLVMMPAMGIGSALATFVGQNIGNSNPGRARKSFNESLKLTSIIMVIGVIVLLPIRERVVTIFLNDKKTINLATEYMIFVGLNLPLMGLFQNLLGVFQGGGKTIYVFLLTSARLWILRIPIILVFKNYSDFGSSGIWYAMLISNIFICLIGLIFFKQYRWKKTKMLEN